MIRPSLGPSKTGAANFRPNAWPAQPRCVSKICPTFMREGTPNGFRTISTGVPSGRNGMSSSGITRAITPLLPCRPAILSPADSFRFIAIEIVTVLSTPGDNSSPWRSFSTFLSLSFSSTSICRIVICSSPSTLNSRSSTGSAKRKRLRSRARMRSKWSLPKTSSALAKRRLVFSSCRSAVTTLPPSSSSRRSTLWSYRMRFSSSRLRCRRSISASSMAFARESFSTPLRENTFAPTTTPETPAGQRSDASLTSSALSPKIARKSFSSGVNCTSPRGTTLPTKMSSGPTLAPIRMMPLSSRF